MPFDPYGPDVARCALLLQQASKEASEAQGKKLLAEGAFIAEVQKRLKAQGLSEGRSIYHTQKDGKTVKRKVLAIQVLGAGQPGWEVAVHLEDPASDWGIIASLRNVHLRDGQHKFIPRERA